MTPFEHPIGLFGGAFDPPHLGHAHILLEASKQLDIKHWVIMPTGKAVHRESSQTSAHHRLRMCQLAFERLQNLHVDVCDHEIKQDKPSYTIDTLRALQQGNPGHSWFVLIGQDQWNQFHTWRDSQDLLKLATFAVAQRHANEPNGLVSNSDLSNSTFDNTKQVIHLFMNIHEANSTTLRQELQQAAHRDHPHPWLEPTVQGYITQHHLYSGTT